MTLEQLRADWPERIANVARSRRFTWIGEGLGGVTSETALTNMTADIMHLCHREGISFEELLERSRQLYEREEREHTSSASRELAHAR